MAAVIGNSTLSKISLGADFTMIAAMATLVFWVGGQAEKQEQTRDEVEKQREQIADLTVSTTRVSGQMLQMAGSSNVAAVEQRVAVVETKVDSQEQFAKEMKSDLVTRLSRIENKIDNGR